MQKFFAELGFHHRIGEYIFSVFHIEMALGKDICTRSSLPQIGYDKKNLTCNVLLIWGWFRDDGVEVVHADLCEREAETVDWGWLRAAVVEALAKTSVQRVVVLEQLKNANLSNFSFFQEMLFGSAQNLKHIRRFYILRDFFTTQIWIIRQPKLVQSAFWEKDISKTSLHLFVWAYKFPCKDHKQK